jgi:glycosyltransferase involved in cell wall biosynthesis
MKKPTLAIFVPAFNEENNIGQLMLDIILQKITLAKLQEIVVISDGSSDKTAAVAKKFAYAGVRVLDKRQRLGKAARQNEMIASCKSDILVMLDADITIPDTSYIDKLITPIVTHDVHMTSSEIEPLTDRNFMEHVLTVSAAMKKKLYYNFKGGNNIYNTYGIARAFARTFYRTLQYRINEGEDMYSYLACITHGFRFKTVTGAIAYFRLPSSLPDHYKQSIRFMYAKNKMSEYFDPKLIDYEFRIPMVVKLKSAFASLPIVLRNPVHVLYYVLVLAGAIIKSKTPTKRDLWNVKSSKIVRTPASA